MFSEMNKWIAKHFPGAEIREFGTLIRGTIDNEGDYYSDSRNKDSNIRVLRCNKIFGSEVRSDQDVFFHQNKGKKFYPMNAMLKDNHVVFNRYDVSCVTMFVDVDESHECFADSSKVILRAKSEEIARFIVWYMSLEFVSRELMSYVKDKKSWRIEHFPVPYADYLKDKNFIDALKDIAEAENRIAKNANEMMEKLKLIREEILLELSK
jgi:hypothetical protein